MPYTITTMQDEHVEALLGIFNSYIPQSYAVYLNTPLSFDSFVALRRACLRSLTILWKAKEPVGFAFLRPYHSASTFRRAGEVSYFISAEHTHRGLGTRLLQELVEGARKHEMDCVLANVCSLNPESLAFHERHGFKQCGVFRNVGRKNGRDFSVVWFQKTI